jgi:peptide/nickel transport system ATP-binding protein
VPSVGSAQPLTPLVSIRGLSVEFTRRRRTVLAVDDVSLDWNRGEVLGLIGESGCGKSTLARTIVGLQAPTRGEIVLAGREADRLDRLERSRLLQMVFQDPYQSLDPRQPIGAQVTEGLNVHRVGNRAERARVAIRALHDAGLYPADGVWDKLPHELSGGQRQRAVIAGALAVDPEGLVCDEPVSALDVSVRAQVLALLAELRERRGLSMLFITHDVGLAWAICDRVAVMYRGRVVELGDTEDVLLRPRHAYTRTLLAAVPAAAPSHGDGGA